MSEFKVYFPSSRRRSGCGGVFLGGGVFLNLTPFLLKHFFEIVGSIQLVRERLGLLKCVALYCLASPSGDTSMSGIARNTIFCNTWAPEPLPLHTLMISSHTPSSSLDTESVGNTDRTAPQAYTQGTPTASPTRRSMLESPHPLHTQRQ